MSSTNSYIPETELTVPRAEDILTREVPFGQAIDFIEGCKVFAEIIQKEKPDIVFFPQRGAGPMSWVTQGFLESEGRSLPTIVDLPIGSHILINDERQPLHGIKSNQKRGVIDSIFDELVERGVYSPVGRNTTVSQEDPDVDYGHGAQAVRNTPRLMLIDEVQKGGTITEAATAIRESMAKRGDNGVLRVVAVQDSRHKLLGDSRKDSYRRLAANERPGFKTTVLPTALFMVDRPQFLDQIHKLTDSKEGFSEDFIISENEEARSLFKTLIDVYLNPESALVELERLRRQDIVKNLGESVLQQELLEAITDPRLIKVGKRANDAQLLGWWQNFAKSVIAHNGHEQVGRSVDREEQLALFNS